MDNLVEIVKNLGLSEKAAKLYLACLELGEATVQKLSKATSIKRTTIYYILGELKLSGAVTETERNKKTYYIAEDPRILLKRVKEKLWGFEQSLKTIEGKKHSVFKRPRVYFLYGPMGFKKIWDMILGSSKREYRIITEGESFFDFVREKYILDEIIKTKKSKGISSRQLISDSPYARDIVAKDLRENRVSKILPSRHKLPFTEIITDDFVAFISPRYDNTLFVVENELFAKTRQSLFEILWDSLR